MYNGDFSKWSAGLNFAVGPTDGRRTADGWYVGPGINGIVAVNRNQVPIGTLSAAPDARYCMECNWTTGYTNPPDQTPWMTIIEYGEVYGADGGTGIDNGNGNRGYNSTATAGMGVRKHAGKTVQYQLYAKVPVGPVLVRGLVWQSFGAGPNASSTCYYRGDAVELRDDMWTLIGETFQIAPLTGKQTDWGVVPSGPDTGKPLGADYFGFGLDIKDGAAPHLQICAADCFEI